MMAMLKTSQILGELIRDYVKAADKGNQECRLVVPGLTENIARQVHEFLRESHLPESVKTYLIIGEKDQPSEETGKIRAAGLTSKRIGSFIAIVDPGEMVNIRDSIRGSGGTIRSLIFSEEWPWIDDGDELFRFRGPFLDAIIDGWSRDPSEKEWLRQFVLKGLLENTRTLPIKANIFLENILGQFNPESHLEIPDVRARLLYQAGIPRPTGTIPPVDKLIKETGKLSKSILDRYKKSELRSQVLEIVPEVIPEADQEAVKLSLDVFFDGLGGSTTLELGLLSFYGCWGNNPEDTSHWRNLNTERLKALFSIIEPIELSYSVRCSRGKINDDGNKLATFHGEEISLEVDYQIAAGDFTAGTWELMVLNRQQPIIKRELVENKGTVPLAFNSSSIKKYSKKLPIRIALSMNGVVKHALRLDLHVCGQDRPAFVIVEPGFEVVDATLEKDEESPDTISVDVPINLFLFGHAPSGPSIRDEKGQEYPLKDTGIDGIWQSKNQIDPSGHPSGEMRLVCNFGELNAFLNIEAIDPGRGEFTIEDELRSMIPGTNKESLVFLIKLFEGSSREPYKKLGKMDDKARWRTFLAKIMSNESGWHPLLANLFVADIGKQGTYGNYINYIGAVGGEEFTTLTLPGDAELLLRAYSDARDAIIREVESRLDKEGLAIEHPTYASHPLFVYESSQQMESLIGEYLETYNQILTYIQSPQRDLDLRQLFVMTHLDCVVHWDNTNLRSTFFLLGPWHPLVVAKRFMLQATLLSRAQLVRNALDNPVFRPLSSLLGRVRGFRWVLVSSAKKRGLTAAYVSTTSDPGWQIAFEDVCHKEAIESEMGGLSGISKRLFDNLGIAMDFTSGSFKNLPVTALSNYLKAFPSRRSIGVRVRRGYASWEAAKDIDDFLHDNDGPSFEGEQLSGGIRLYLEEELDSNVSINRLKPPLYIYTFDNDRECIEKGSPDIYVMPPASTLNFEKSEKVYEVPRGSGYHAIFSEPLRWLEEVITFIPNSFNYEFDATLADDSHAVTNGISNVFIRVLKQPNNALQKAIITMSPLDFKRDLSAPWVVIPGESIDPAVLVKYVRDATGGTGLERALWDYKMDLGKQVNSFFVLSTVPHRFNVSVNGFFEKDDVANEFINDLGHIGIAIGGEALKTGRHAHGIIGLVGAVRLFTRPASDGRRLLPNGPEVVGFLIPVDSFESFFGRSESGKERRADLLAVKFVMPGNGNGKLRILACGVESKFVSGAYDEARAQSALEQGLKTSEIFKDLIVESLKPGNIPERLALLELLKFGLRITSPSKAGDIRRWIDIERVVYQAILTGNYEYYPNTPYKAIVVSTEGGLPGGADYIPLGNGIWVRLTKTHWPGVEDTTQLDNIKLKLLSWFEVRTDFEKPPTPVTGTEPAPRVADRIPDTGEIPKELKPIFLGVDDARRPVYFNPQSAEDRLDNLNIMVTGSSGKGKTQFLKYLIYQLREQGTNVLILDFKNDFAIDAEFARRSKLSTVFVRGDGLPYNPLIPYPEKDPRTGVMEFHPAQHISGVTSIFKRTYKLGDQQAAALKEAIVAAYQSAGIQTTGIFRSLDQSQLPDFSVVGNILRHNNPRAFNRLEPLFSLEIFKPEFRGVSYNELISRSLIIDLSRIPSEEIKNALAQLVVMSAHSSLNSLQPSGDIRQMLVIDEASRVLDYESIVNFVLQCRAYGVGIILSSQYPSHFPADVSSSMATKIIHGNDADANRVRDIVRLLGCEGLQREISRLGRFEAVMYNRHYPNKLIKTMNYPLYLIWSNLQKLDTTTKEDLARTEGINQQMLKIEYLVHLLEFMGLAEEKEGKVIAINPPN